MAAGQLDQARQAFRAALDLVARYRAVAIVHVIAGGHLAEIDRLEGRVADAEANSRAVLDLAEQAGLADNPECTVALLTLGNVLLDRGRVAGGGTVHRPRHRTGRTAALRGP